MASDYVGMKSKDENDSDQGCVKPYLGLWCGLAVWGFSLILTENNGEGAILFCQRVKMKTHPSSWSWLPALTQCRYLQVLILNNWCTSPQNRRCCSSDRVLLNKLVWKLMGHGQIDCVDACGSPSCEWTNFVLCSPSFSLNWIVGTHLLKSNVI